MKPYVFWHEFTFSEFQRKAFFFFRNKNDEYKDRWERSRRVAYIGALVQGAKVSEAELMPLPWDKKEAEKVYKPISKKEVNAILNTYNIKPKDK